MSDALSQLIDLDTPNSDGDWARPNRRSFLKWSAVVGGSAALVSTTTPLGIPGTRATLAVADDGMPGVDKTVWSACTVNCGSRCPLRLQVKDGTVVRVLTDNTGGDELGSQQVRACVRGRSIRHRIYNPDRLKRPMKRKPGTKRGEEQWEEISWDQALDEITDKMKEIKAEYGNEAFYINYGTGVLGSTMACSWPPDATPFARLMNTWGGYLDHYSDYSTTEITQAYPYFYGDWVDSNSFDDAANAKLQVMFGNNPLETRMSGGGQLAVTQMTRKEHGIRTIVIDPRLSETAVALGDDWVPIRPGTDAALVAGMIHVMISEDLQDQKFLDKYCVGFDEDTLPKGAEPNSSYRSYLEGLGPDGVEKTPEWAAKITGLPARRIRQLARDIATAKPCAITQGWGPQRHANGENNARAIFLLACATGNIGIAGGGTGAREGSSGLPLARPFETDLINPSEKIISVFSWLDAIDHGEEMDTFNAGVGEKPGPGIRALKVPVDDDGKPTNTKLDVPIKMVWQYSGNSIINQTGDNNRSVEILQDDSKCELIVVCDIQYTTSARYADYILPGTSTAEEFDFHPGENSGPMGYGIVSEQAIEPLYECKSVYDICTEMAKRFGTEEEFTGGKSREDWLRQTIKESQADDPDLPDYDEWREMGLFRKDIGPFVSMAEFREDPKENPLSTPSGKIEVFSDRLAAMSRKWTFDDFRPELPGDKLTPLPEHVDTWEGTLEARDHDEYPLQVIGHHFKGRTHSTYGNLPRNREAHPQKAWMNPLDAKSRGISNDDRVRIWNDRGALTVQVMVTPRIMPGVVSVPQGAWIERGPDGTDHGGCVNVLTSQHPTPLAKGNAQHTVLAQVALSAPVGGAGAPTPRTGQPV